MAQPCALPGGDPDAQQVCMLTMLCWCLVLCRKHNVIVSLDQCMAWDDQCCKLRVARPGTAGKAAPAGPQSEGAAQQ
jgi:hypothetical protein